MQSAHIRHDGAAYHDVMEVGDHEVRIGHVHVHAEGGDEQTSQSADREQADESERVKHGRGKGYRTLIESGRPVEYLDGRGDRHEVAQEREDHAGEQRLAADEQVMAPDQEPDNRNGDARESHETVTKNALARKRGDQLANNSHSREHHDVHGGVGIEPEKMLEKYRIATESRVEDADVEHALAQNQHQSHSQHRGAQHLDQAGGIVSPYEQRHAEPSHTRRAHAVHRHDEVEAGENG